MTVNDTKDVQLLVKQISDEQDDFEMAHNDEDDLYEAVLKEVVEQYINNQKYNETKKRPNGR